MLACAPGRPVHHVGPRDDRTQRQARGDAFGQADDIGHDVPVFDGTHPSRAAHPRLHFVDDVQDAVLFGKRLEIAMEFRRRDDVSPFALNGLDENGRHLVGRHEPMEQRVFDRRHALDPAISVGEILRTMPAVGVRMCVTPGTSGPKPCRCVTLLAVSDSDPMVRP